MNANDTAAETKLYHVWMYENGSDEAVSAIVRATSEPEAERKARSSGYGPQWDCFVRAMEFADDVCYLH